MLNTVREKLDGQIPLLKKWTTEKGHKRMMKALIEYEKLHNIAHDLLNRGHMPGDVHFVPNEQRPPGFLIEYHKQVGKVEEKLRKVAAYRDAAKARKIRSDADQFKFYKNDTKATERGVHWGCEENVASGILGAFVLPIKQAIQLESGQDQPIVNFACAKVLFDQRLQRIKDIYKAARLSVDNESRGGEDSSNHIGSSHQAHSSQSPS